MTINCFPETFSKLEKFLIVTAKFIDVDLETNSLHTEKVEAFNLFIKDNEWRSLPSDKFRCFVLSIPLMC